MGREVGDLPHSATAKPDLESGPGTVEPYTPSESWTAWIIHMFVVVNVATFIYSMYVNNCVGSPRDLIDGCVFPSLGRFAFEPLSINPLLGPSVQTLDALGALDYNKIVIDGEGWRLFSCIWLHAGVLHLAANMMSLLFIGVRLEQEFGFVKIGTLYALSGFGGSLVSSLYIHSKISVGASGALFGLLGSMLSEVITNWTIYANKCAALLTLIVIIIINLAVGMVPHVDSSAHVGGFIYGFLLGFILLIRPQFGYVSRKYISSSYNVNYVKPKHKLYQQLLWISALVFLLIGYIIGLVKLYNCKQIRET